MAAFGDTFARAARAPLDRSSKLFNDTRLGDGIRGLEVPLLEGAMHDGLMAVSALTGVPATTIQLLLPQEELRACLDRLQKRQTKALASVRRQEMTVATFAMPDELPTAPNPSEHLTSLAATFARDKDISSGLRDLAFEIAAWEALLKRCSAALDADPQLDRSFRRQRLVRGLLTWGLLALGVVAVAGAGLFFVSRAAEQRRQAEARERELAVAAQTRKKLEAALALPDPCQPDSLADDDRARLTDADRGRLDERARRCEAARQQRLQEQRCEDLVAHVTANQLSADDAQLAGAAEPTLRRLASRSLTGADLSLADDAMPCAGSRAQGRLWEHLARVAAAGGPNLWGLSEGVSPRLAAQLAVPGVLHQATILAIAFRAEKLATAALRTGRDDDVRRARSLCALKTSLQQALALSCQKVSKG